MALAFAVLLAAACGALPVLAQEVSYTIAYAPARSSPTWEVAATVDGVNPPFEVRLPVWGEWAGSDPGYFSGLEAERGARLEQVAPFRYKVERRAGQAGPVRLQYRLRPRPWGEQDDRTSLLPFCSEVACHGFAHNTLLWVLKDGRLVRGRRTLAFDVPPGWTAATGWADPGPAGSAVELDDSYDNGVISFGKGLLSASAEGGEVRYQVTLNGLDADISRQTLDRVRRVYELESRVMGGPAKRVVRVFVTGSGATGTNGGCDTPHGVHLTAVDAARFGSLSHKLLAHELLHDWIGGALRGGARPEELDWFKEGLTDYMAARMVVASGYEKPGWLAARLEEMDRSAGKPGAAEVAAADARGDLAYPKGFLAAFHLDLRLRLENGSSLAAMLRDLLAGPDRGYSREAVGAWLAAHGLGDFFKERVLKPGLPDLETELRRLGYERGDVPARVAYLGIAAEETAEGDFVRGLDPDGPATAAGLRVGDRVIGYVSTRSDGARPGPSAPPYPYGMALFDPDSPVSLGILRGTSRLELLVRPRPMEAGVTAGYRLADPEAEAARKFFSEAP